MIKQKYQALLADWNAQNQLYQPSFFWSEASLELIEEFDKKGIENFRSLASSLSFFVPTFLYKQKCHFSDQKVSKHKVYC